MSPAVYADNASPPVLALHCLSISLLVLGMDLSTLGCSLTSWFLGSAHYSVGNYWTFV